MANRKGFAIPTTLLLVAVMTVSLGAGFALVTSERKTVNDELAQIDALTLAEQGMQTFLVRRDSLGLTTNPPVNEETVRITMTGGYADVTLTRVRPSSAGVNAIYIVRSRGVQTSGAGAGTPQGVRTVAQYVQYRPVSVDIRAGVTSITGLDKNGGSGTLAGADQCGDSADVAGVAVPSSPGYDQNGGNPVPTGSPAIDNFAPNAESAASMVKIDWNSIINNNVITPNITIPTDAWPTARFASDPNYWPVIRVTGGHTSNFTLPSTGRGLLIVEGALTISGGVNWEGLILVGNNLTSNGNNTMYGAIITGLNVKLGYQAINPDVLDVSEANGTKDYRYNSCNVAKAVGAMGGLISYQNTWSDTWSEY